MILAIIGGTLLLTGLTFVGWVIGSYNSFVNAFHDVKNQWSNMKTEYQRRADLLYNLVQAVKSHKKFEKETLTAVIAARQGNFGQNKTAELKNLKNFDSIFNKLMLLFEAYPNLKSNEQHNKLMDEVRITEDRVNIARTDYNAIVNDYNVLLQEFPRNILASFFLWMPEEYFDNAPETNVAPRINLD